MPRDLDPILTDNDVKAINTAIGNVSLCRDMDMKGRKDLLLDLGGRATVYHLGKHSKVIRIDLTGGTTDEP